MIDWRRAAPSETLCRNPRAKCGDVNKKQVKEKNRRQRQDKIRIQQRRIICKSILVRLLIQWRIHFWDMIRERGRCQRGALFGSLRTTARMSWKGRPKLRTESIMTAWKTENDADELFLEWHSTCVTQVLRASRTDVMIVEGRETGTEER